MKGASQIAPLGVRIPDELKEKIQARARKNSRSMNSEIVHILESAFTNEDPEPQKQLSLLQIQEKLLKITEIVEDLERKQRKHNRDD